MSEDPKRISGVKAWEDLDSLSYEQALELTKSHQTALARDEAVSGMHFLEFFPEFDTTPEQVNNAVRQAAADGNATIGLVKDAGRAEPVRFSRRRNYNTATDIFRRGYLIEELLIFPNSKARIFHNISNDDSRARHMAASQELLEGLVDYARISSDEAEIGLCRFRTREPLASEKNAVHNIYLDAVDLKTRLKTATLEERINLIRRVSTIDLTLHGAYQKYITTDKGRRLSRQTGSWKSLWRSRPLLENYVE